MRDLTPGTIHAAAVQELPPCDIDHHMSDLYIRVTPASAALVDRLDNKTLLSTFRSYDGSTWYDLPFCFCPYWGNPRKYI